MEQMRLLIAIVLSFAVFFMWSLFLAPKAPEKAGPEKTITDGSELQEHAEKAPGVQKEPAPSSVLTEPETEKEAIAEEFVDRDARQIVISTPLYEMTISEKGAAVVSMILKDYRESVEEDSALKELISKDLQKGTVLLSLEGGSGAVFEGGLYRADYTSETLQVEQQPADLRFLHTMNGLQIEKTYTFSPVSYLVGLKVKVTNSGDSEIEPEIGLALAKLMDDSSKTYSFEGPCGFVNNKLEQVKVKKIEDNNLIEGDIRWTAIESRYFMSSIIPKEDVNGRMKLDYKNGRVSNKLVVQSPAIASQDNAEFDFNIFMGPKNVSLLKSFNNGLDRAVDFGWVDILAKPCLWFMNFIYRFIPNYGVAIIILTIVTRMIFWPLATKSYKSMGEMRKLQPLMQEIREKYKNDKQKMNQEMMGLYRTYKINPMGGCLPMLIQLPVFFALYRMLYQAIELRHAPFVFWINDLSAPDRLFNFGFKIPFMEPPYGIPVLTLIMAATMFIQQKMTPTPGDPAQAKMMMFLPLIFLFIFINFSSGLVLYWLISNVLSIAQQYYIHKKVA